MSSSREKATFIAAAIAIGAACFAGLVLLPRISPSRADAEIRPAPAFNLPMATKGEPGSRLALEDLKGSPVVLEFWASWCGACAMQSPILDRVARRYQDRGLKVIGVGVQEDNHQAAAAKARNWAYPVVTDESGLTQREYGVDRLPTIVIIDKEGRIVKTTHGLVEESQLERMIKDVL